MNVAALLGPHPNDGTALVSRGKTTTYGELRRQTEELAHSLRGLGIEPGDRVALVSANNWFFVVAYLGVLTAGGVAVPLNPSSPTAELAAQLATVAPKAVILGPSGRSPGDGAALGVRTVLAPESAGIVGATALESLFTGDRLPPVERDAEDLAVLMFTAGTAGSPKAAMLTHGNLLANLDQVQNHPGRAMTAADVTLAVLPLHHIFGLNVVLNLTLMAGASVVLVERFDPSTALETIANHKVTVVPGAPPMYLSWLALPHEDGEVEAFASVRMAVSGAAALGTKVAEDFKLRYGADVFEGYGLTEASPTVTSSVGAGRVKAGSIGVPLAGVELRLVDKSGDDALPGDSGEIWVRGPNVFKGYWQQPEATASVLTADGWLKTGDVAVVDDDGWLFIVDRAKDVIIVSGFNVFPAEVEDALRDHPGVVDAAVVGVAHPHTGEAVKAFVVSPPGVHVEEDQLIDFCAGRLARYKCPSKIMFVDELPKSGTGKLLRRKL